MKKISKILLMLLATCLWLLAVGSVFAQNQSVLKFKSGADTGDDGLGPGELKSPFKCELPYVGRTYPDHSTYSVDFNRDPYGAEDRGDPVLASADGRVAVKIPACGEIIVRHEGDYYSTYVHMQNITVDEGDVVRLGQKIGEISDVATNRPNECRADGPHLHTRQTRGGYLNANAIKLKYINTNYSFGYPASISNPTSYVGPGWKIGGQCN